MTKIKKLKKEYIIYFYIILCPILDIASFLFRNAFDTNISISTFIRPIIPVILAIYIFIKANKKHKLILAGIATIYVVYGAIHLAVTKIFFTGCSYGGIAQELQYVVNYTFLVFNLVVFYYIFINKNWRKEPKINNEKIKTSLDTNEPISSNQIKTTHENKIVEDKSVNQIKNLRISILVMCTIYIVSIYLAILTGTSSYTYPEEQIGYKGWIESGNSLSAILCISTFLILPLIKDKKYRIPTIIVLLLVGVYLVALIGTRVGLIGFFLAVAVFIAVEVLFSKNKVAIIGFVILAVAVITVGLVGSNTLKRRNQMNESQYTIIDESTGEVGHMTGDMLKIKNSILNGTLENGFMSEAQQEAVLKLNDFANEHNLAGNDTRTQQLIYNFYLVLEQKSPIGIIFGNGFETNFREMIMENEIASLLFNFGILGFALYAGPFLAILIYSLIDVIKKIKAKQKLETSYLMAIAGLGLIFALSYLSGYIFFNSSLIAVISVVAIIICSNIRDLRISSKRSR